MERWWAGAVGAQAVVGAAFGGWLVTRFSWRLLFLATGGWGAVLALLGLVALPRETAKGERPSVDAMGAVALVGAMAGAGFFLVEGPALGWTDPKTVAAGVVALVSGVAFVDFERSRARPLLPLRILGSRTIAASVGATLLVHLALAGAVFVVVLHLHRATGFSPVEGGWAAAAVLAALVVAYVASVGIGEQPGARSWAIAGVGASVVGLLLLADVGAGSVYARDILPGAILTGLGCGLALAFETGAVHSSFGNRLAEVAARLAVAGAAAGGLLGVTLLPLVAGVPAAESLGAAALSEAHRQTMRWAVAVLAVAAFLIWISEPSRSSDRSVLRNGS